MHLSIQSFYRTELLLTGLLAIISLPISNARTIETREINAREVVPAAFTRRDSNITDDETNGNDTLLAGLQDEPMLAGAANVTQIQLSQGSTGRQGRKLAEDVLWDFSYSYDSIQSPVGNNSILYATAVNSTDFTSALQDAFNTSNSTTSGPISIDGQYFQTRSNGLSVILSCYNKTNISDGTFVFQAVTRTVIQLNSGRNSNTTLVGVLKDGSGAPYADYAIVPAFIIYNKSQEVISVVTPQNDSSPAPVGGYHSRFNPRLSKRVDQAMDDEQLTKDLDLTMDDYRLSKRTDLAVDNTNLKLRIHVGIIKLTSAALTMTARAVYDSLNLQHNAPISYSAYTGNECASMFGENAVFSFQALGFNRIRHTDMVEISRQLYRKVSSYIDDLGVGRNDPISNLYGSILDEAGTVIAQWALGKVLQSIPDGLCPAIVVEQPDGYRCLGCWVGSS